MRETPITPEESRPLTPDEGAELLRLWDQEAAGPPLEYEPRALRGVTAPWPR